MLDLSSLFIERAYSVRLPLSLEIVLQSDEILAHPKRVIEALHRLLERFGLHNPAMQNLLSVVRASAGRIRRAVESLVSRHRLVVLIPSERVDSIWAPVEASPDFCGLDFDGSVDEPLCAAGEKCDYGHVIRWHRLKPVAQPPIECSSRRNGGAPQRKKDVRFVRRLFHPLVECEILLPCRTIDVR